METKDKELNMIGYIRVSTKEQATKGISLEDQERRIRGYALSQYPPMHIIRIETDAGLSGKTMDRVGLQSVFKAMEDNEADGVIVVKLDRFSRKTRDILKVVDDVFRKNDKILHSLNEKIDTSSAMGQFLLTVFAGLAQLEREQTVERIKSVLDMKKEKGERLGTNPFGFKTVYDKDDKKSAGALVPVIEELRLLKEIVDNREKGWTYWDICKNLEGRGIKSKQGKNWWPPTISYIIKNPKTKVALETLQELEEEERLKELAIKAEKEDLSKEELDEIEKIAEGNKEIKDEDNANKDDS